MSFSIDTVSTTDFPSIITIGNKLFGNDFLTHKELEDYIYDNSKECLVAKINNQVAGFVMVQVCELNELQDLALADKDWFIKQFEQNLPIGVVKTIAVSSEFKKQGVGMALTSKGIEILKEKSNTIISICWDQGDDTPFVRLLEKNGLKSVRKISEFWKEDSLFKKYNCKICGSPPCKCNAYIYQS